MKSIFLKLSSFRFGAARRHCPFTSIIHKHVLPFFFALVVLLFSSVSVSVSASTVPVELTPVIDSKIDQLKEYVDDILTSAQRDMFVFLLGTYGAAQAGFSYEKLDTSYSDSSGTVSWLKRFGDKLYNTMVDTMYSPYFQALDVRTYLYRAVDYALGVAKSVRKYSAFQDLLDDIDSSTHFFIPVDTELQASINSFVGLNNGFYDWQFDTEPFAYNAAYNIVSMSDTQQASYDTYLTRFPDPSIRTNYGSYYNVRMLNNVSLVPIFSTYKYLFINTDLHRITLVDENGDSLNNTWYDFILVNSSGDYFTRSFEIRNLFNVSYNASDYTRVVDVARAYFNNTFNTSQYKLFFQDLIEHVYAGSSWALKHEVFNVEDLNLVNNESPSYDQISAEMLIDIKGFLSDLIDEVDLHTVILNNLFNPDGTLNVSPLTNDVSVEFPSSGVTVPPSLFSGFFNSNDGFISYLWYMTKPLVVYTHDLLDCFWFGPEDGFDWSGPAPIVFGVVSLGLIGGLVVKMLL